MVLPEELGDGQGFVEFGDGALVRLFGGGYDQALDALSFEDAALGVIAEKRRDAVDPDFRGLFGEPFETVDVLGRADRHMEPVVVAAVVLDPFVHVEKHAARVIVHNRAAVEHTVTVHYVDLIAAPMAQHTHAMRRLVGIEHPSAAGYVF